MIAADINLLLRCKLKTFFGVFVVGCMAFKTFLWP